VPLLAVVTWTLLRAVTDPEFFEGRRAIVAFVGAPLLLLVFGYVTVVSIRDVLQGTDSLPDARIATALSGWRGWTLASVYVVAMAWALSVLL